MDFLQEAQKIKSELITIRRYLHQNPELSFQEYNTAKYIAGLLQKWGLKVKTNVGGTGVIGLLSPSAQSPAKCVALRADMDALPIQEQTGKSYASKNSGVMHACGHDGNMTCVLGAARILSARRQELKSTVKFIFQPAEEVAGGAEAIIRAGALKNPTVAVIIGLHVNSALDAGKIGIKQGQMMASVDQFELTIIGESGHGAAPHKGVDAIAVSAEVITALQQVVSRKIDPLDPVVLTIGTINGGSRYNILADRVTMTGTVRTLNEKTHKNMPLLIEKIVKGVVSAFDAKYKLNYKILGVSLKNDEQVLVKVRAEAIKLLGTNGVRDLNCPSMGGEDFASYLQKVPGAFFYLGVKNQAKGTNFTWHHPRFDLDEEALPIGAAVLAQSAGSWTTR